MPIYEYECEKCGKVFEQLVASHKAKGQCPACNAKTARRMVSTFSAHGGSASMPCDSSGQCPGGPAAGGGCAGGSCPFS